MFSFRKVTVQSSRQSHKLDFRGQMCSGTLRITSCALRKGWMETRLMSLHVKDLKTILKLTSTVNQLKVSFHNNSKNLLPRLKTLIMNQLSSSSPLTVH